MNDDRMALIAKALGHPARIQIIRLLSAQTECRGHEVFAEFALAQSTVSQHLATLKEAGIVCATPVGTSAVYCLVASALDEFCEGLGALSLAAVACEHEAEVC